ncbi:MAG TPA: WD40 repeat domain-containing protein [Oligoflexus sp.]|uniref:WD40 repeat domain-containing protein n=1 Tax=Oligoflexus sp. TaxID=1971216 RepID=UPI002D549F8B|nr:WD40 repeat domain-containing protein [Oligoflexus sp.]HYX38912.1 WD40 repeat domain-containing protein [Oligoflexus sp.]
MLRLFLVALLFIGCTRLNNTYDQDSLDCGPELARGQEFLTVVNSRGIRMHSGFEVVNLNSWNPEALATSQGCIVKKSEGRYLIRSNGTDEARVMDMSQYENRSQVELEDYTGQSVAIACKEEVRTVGSASALQGLLQTNLQSNLHDAVQLEYEFVKPVRSRAAFSLADASQSLPLLGETDERVYELKVVVSNLLSMGKVEATCRLQLDRTPPQAFVSLNSKKPEEAIEVHGTTQIVPVGLVDSISFLADINDGVTISYCLVPLNDDFDESDTEAKNTWKSSTQSKDCLGHKVLTASPGTAIASEVKSGFWSIKFYATDAVGNVAPPQIQNILVLNRDSHQRVRDIALAGIGAKSSMRVVENALRAEVLRNNLPTRYERNLEKNIVLSGLLRAYYQEAIAVEINANQAYIKAIAVSENGQFLVSTSYDGTLNLWNIATGQNIWSVSSKMLHAIAISPNGKYIVGIDQSSSVVAFDGENGSYLRTIKLYDRSKEIPHKIQFGPDNLSVLIDSGNDIEIWSFEEGKILRVLQGHTKGIHDFKVVPGRQMVVSVAADRTLRYWDFATAVNLKIIETSTIFSSSKPPDPDQIAISSDGKRIVVMFTRDGAATWNDEGVFVDRAWKLSTSTSLIAVKRDGTLFTADADIKVWAADDIKQTLHEDTAPILEMFLSPDERRLITASDDSTIRIWNLETIKEKQVLQAPHEITSLVYSRDGENLISGSMGSGDLLLWPLKNSNTPITLAKHKEVVGALAISGDGKHLVSGDYGGNIIVQNYPGACCRTFEFKPVEAISSVSLSHDGRYLVATTTNGGAKLWDMGGSGEPLDVAGPMAGTVAAISPDGSRIAVAGLNAQSNIDIRDSQSGKVLFSLMGNSGFMNGLPMSADGQRLAAFGPSGNSINVWDLPSHKMVSRVVGDYQGVVMTLAITPTGSRAIAGTLNGKILMIDFEQEQQISIPMHGSLPSIGVAIAPDGRTFATGGYDKMMRIWDFDNGPLHENICARLKSYLDPELCRGFSQ